MRSQPVIGIQRVLIRAACLSSLPSYSGAASPEAEHLTGTHSHEKRRRKRRTGTGTRHCHCCCCCWCYCCWWVGGLVTRKRLGRGERERPRDVDCSCLYIYVFSCLSHWAPQPEPKKTTQRRLRQ